MNIGYNMYGGVTMKMVFNDNAPPSGSFIDLTEYSSNLGGILWHGDGVMDVTFQSGGTYRYHFVPSGLWEFLLTGKETQDKNDKFSIGAAFHQEVIQKPDLYPYEKL